MCSLEYIHFTGIPNDLQVKMLLTYPWHAQGFSPVTATGDDHHCRFFRRRFSSPAIDKNTNKSYYINKNNIKHKNKNIWFYFSGEIGECAGYFWTDRW
jgi:hypothetical protein